MDLETAKFCAIDIETTGLDPDKDEIISFACVPIVNLKILVGETYYTLIKPAKYDYSAMKYHGISRDDLMDAPSFGEVSGRIMNLLDGILIGHTVEFDFTFLKKGFKANRVRFKREIIDIAAVERWIRWERGKDEDETTLDSMITSYGLKSYYRHNAAADAFFAAQIFQMQLREMMALGIDSAKKIIKVAKQCKYSDRDFIF
jgi:DNA polymerase-3 subunit epsilon